MNKIKKITRGIACGILAATIALCGACESVLAESSFSVSPMKQKIVLTPGETYHGTFSISNPGSNTEDFSYRLAVTPFYVDENYEIKYENNGDYSQIVDWIAIDNETGVIAPNNTKEIAFTINVPNNVPTGGQYAAITVTSDTEADQIEGLNLQAKYSIVHIIYAEIAGTTQRSGDVQSANVPGFLFSGKISGTSTIKNTGNVHSDATYKLQVFPLFSNEEVYTNVENPDTKTILPDRALYNTTSWEETPSIGIFNVIYTAEFEGVTTEVKKMVIICPIWLLIIIIIAIIALVVWLYTRSKSRKK